ncbi:Protein FAM171B Precursor [Channa argus]|uniref:Protein FAM171B n=1 Tax=Channa argus TaxID=215402 RepID=A0A6G1PXX8_CHAAH|nr:Protein FAM171B Precursor [Channa argus]
MTPINKSSVGLVRLFISLISALIFCQIGKATEESAPTAGRALHIDDGNFSNRNRTGQEPFQSQQQVLDPRPGSYFNLKVQVNDMLSHQHLQQAVVDVYTNYTRTHTALTGEDGGVLLHVPYEMGLPIMIVVSKDGYICQLLPCKTRSLPIFSSVTMSLLALNQGNIWFFDDSVLITGKTSDASSHPVVQFPKSLLNLTNTSNVTTVKAYMTIPKLSSDDESFSTFGIMSSKSGYVSVELSPVAAVSVQIFSEDTELHVNGPIEIRLSITGNCGLKTSDVVPAWFFNQTTGFFGLAHPTDFLLQDSSFLVALLGGMLVFIALLVGLLYCYRRSLRDTKTQKTQPIIKKDQTTSTCDHDIIELSSGDNSEPQNGLNKSFTERDDTQHRASVNSMHSSSVIANPNAVAIPMECNELGLKTDLDNLMCLHKTAEHMKVPAPLTENLFFYNQPVAILHAPAFFHLEEQSEQHQWSRSATLPRAGASNSAASESLNKDSFTQTLSKGPSLTQTAETEDQLGVLGGSQEATSTNTSRSHFSFPESASVPGTLNKIRDSRHSVHGLAELSKIPSTQAPRAWFVSLEGKPAAEIHYAVSEQQRRRRPVESRETSLDSGVDMSELNQSSGRRTVTVERNATFVKTSKNAPPQ